MELLRKCLSREISFAQNAEELAQKMESSEYASIAVEREQECRICKWELVSMSKCRCHVTDAEVEEERHLVIAQNAEAKESYQIPKISKFSSKEE